LKGGHSKKGSVSEGTMNFIQFLSGITQALKTKARMERTSISRSITNLSNLSYFPFYTGKTSKNFGRIGTNVQVIGFSLLQA